MDAVIRGLTRCEYLSIQPRRLFVDILTSDTCLYGNSLITCIQEGVELVDTDGVVEVYIDYTCISIVEPITVSKRIC